MIRMECRDGPGPKAPQREEVSWGDEVNKIFVTIQGGTRLPELEDGPPCPYIVTSLGPQTHITKTLGPSTEPVWDMEVAEFNLPPVNTRGRTNLHIKLYHWVASQSRLLGEARVPINQLAAFTAKPQECSCSLLRPDGNPLRSDAPHPMRLIPCASSRFQQRQGQRLSCRRRIKPQTLNPKP